MPFRDTRIPRLSRTHLQLTLSGGRIRAAMHTRHQQFALHVSQCRCSHEELTPSKGRGGAEGLLSLGGGWKSSRQTGHDSEGYCWLLSAAACSRLSFSSNDWQCLERRPSDLFRLHSKHTHEQSDQQLSTLRCTGACSAALPALASAVPGATGSVSLAYP